MCSLRRAWPADTPATAVRVLVSGRGEGRGGEDGRRQVLAASAPEASLYLCGGEIVACGQDSGLIGTQQIVQSVRAKESES